MHENFFEKFWQSTTDLAETPISEHLFHFIHFTTPDLSPFMRTNPEIKIQCSSYSLTQHNEHIIMGGAEISSDVETVQFSKGEEGGD